MIAWKEGEKGVGCICRGMVDGKDREVGPRGLKQF